MLKEVEMREEIIDVDPFELLRGDILSYPLLNAEEEKTLSRNYIFGKKCKQELNACLENKLPFNESLLEHIQVGVDAREKLINSNLRLVTGLAYKFSGTNTDEGKIKDDIIQNFFAGCEGLIKAVDGFDPEKGNRFSTYARIKIEKAIVMNLRWFNIYVPTWVRESIHKYNKILEEYELINGERPSDDYVLKWLKISQKQLDMIRNAYNINHRTTILEEINDNQEVNYLVPSFYNQDFSEKYFGLQRPTEVEALDKVSLNQLDTQMYKTLKKEINTPMKMEIFIHSFILGLKKNTEIANDFKVSPQYIDQEKKRLTKILKNNKEFISFCIDYLGLRDYTENNDLSSLD